MIWMMEPSQSKGKGNIGEICHGFRHKSGFLAIQIPIFSHLFPHHSKPAEQWGITGRIEDGDIPVKHCPATATPSQIFILQFPLQTQPLVVHWYSLNPGLTGHLSLSFLRGRGQWHWFWRLLPFLLSTSPSGSPIALSCATPAWEGTLSPRSLQQKFKSNRTLISTTSPKMRFVFIFNQDPGNSFIPSIPVPAQRRCPWREDNGNF